MAGNKLTINLTADQQRQIREATGKTITALTVEPGADGQLSLQDLEGAVGGVKTISWSGSGDSGDNA